MPKQGRFFDLFEAHAATLVAGADALARLLQGGPDMEAHIREIVLQRASTPTTSRATCCRTCAAPSSRRSTARAITGLIGVMDDAIDQMNQTAKAIASVRGRASSSRRCATCRASSSRPRASPPRRSRCCASLGAERRPAAHAHRAADRDRRPCRRDPRRRPQGAVQGQRASDPMDFIVGQRDLRPSRKDRRPVRGCRERDPGSRASITPDPH